MVCLRSRGGSEHPRERQLVGPRRGKTFVQGVILIKHLITVVGITLGIAAWLVGDVRSQSVDRSDPVETEDLEIVRRPNYQGAYWLFLSDRYAEGADEPVGYATWDPVQRRYTFFNMKGEYKGFYQATIGHRVSLDFEPFYQTPLDIGEEGTHRYEQFLTYDKNNRYKGVIVVGLGGRGVTESNPYGELGGRFRMYLRGNIPVPYPAIRPRIGPYQSIEDLLGADLYRPKATR